jgi:tetratricopeptide (TPR) repeat protein
MGLLEPEASEPSVDAGAAAADDAEWSVDAADVVTGPADVVADDEDEALWTEEDLLPPLAPDVAADDAGDAGAEPDMVTDAALMAEPDPDALDALDAFEGIQVIEAPVAEPEPPVDESAAPESMPEAPSAAAPAPAPAPAPASPAAPVAPVRSASGDPLDFVDLGALIMEEESPRDSRMKGEQLETTGDEQRDFEEMLAQFKKGIDENLSHDDYEAHYDLGVAFKEMGLLDEAIAEFQKALRAPESRLRTSEALGVAFYEKGQYPVSEAVLRRAVDTLSGGDDSKIGLIYWLGRSCEAQGKDPEARAHYERAMAQDIRFMDLQERMKRLAPARR